MMSKNDRIRLVVVFEVKVFRSGVVGESKLSPEQSLSSSSPVAESPERPSPK